MIDVTQLRRTSGNSIIPTTSIHKQTFYSRRTSSFVHLKRKTDLFDRVHFHFLKISIDEPILRIYIYATILPVSNHVKKLRNGKKRRKKKERKENERNENGIAVANNTRNVSQFCFRKWQTTLAVYVKLDENYATVGEMYDRT